jgi:hypothetical protein
MLLKHRAERRVVNPNCHKLKRSDAVPLAVDVNTTLLKICMFAAGEEGESR